MFDLYAFAKQLAGVPPDRRIRFIKEFLNGIPDAQQRAEAETQILLLQELGGPPPPAKQVVVLLHGIRTRAEWQERFRSRLIPFDHVRVYPIGYDYFDAFRFWCPALFRWVPVRRVLKEIREIRAKHQGEDISVIAHSFGTYIISRILLKETDIQLRRLLLCGSIVRMRFPWSRLPKQPFDGIVNDVGEADVWPVLAKCSSWGYGPSGTFGFKTNAVTDRFFPLKHSEFFSDDHETRYWIPYLIEGRVVPSEWDESRKVTPWWMSLLPWLPLKIGLLAGTLLAVAHFWPTALSNATTWTSAKAKSYIGNGFGKAVEDAEPVAIDFKTKNNGQTPGCACGNREITFPGEMRGKVGQPLSFRYDGSEVCRGQAFRNFNGSIHWTPTESTPMVNRNDNGSFPGIAGTIRVTFAQPETYTLRATFTLDCVDRPDSGGCSSSCSASGTTSVWIK